MLVRPPFVFARFDRGVQAWRIEDGTEAWTFTPLATPSARTGEWLQASIVASHGRIFVADSAARVYCIDERSGAALWQDQAAAGATIVTTPVVKDGLVVTCTLDGNLTAYEAETGSRVWQAHVAGATFGDMLALGERIVVASANALYILNTTSFQVTRVVNVAPSHSRLVFLSKSTETLYTIASDPRFSHVRVVPESMPARREAPYTLIAVRDEQLLFERESWAQRVRWAATTGMLYEPTNRRGLWIADPETGEVHHQLLHDTPLGLPEVEAGMIYTLDSEGMVFALGDPTVA